MTQPLKIVSNKLLATGEWHNVRIAVSGRKIVLSVNGLINRAVLANGDAFIFHKPLFYIGK